MVVSIYLLIGAFAGLVAGLFGVGGGLIIVPILILSFTLQGLSTDVLTHLAIGTSLATIIVTSLSSVMAHHGKGAVDWDVFMKMAPGIVLGAWLGSLTADHLSGTVLQLLIGCLAILVALKMIFGLQTNSSGTLPGPPMLFVSGGVIGWVSTIFGIGGGSLSVPFFIRCNLVMQRAVATSSACGLPIAVAGAMGNMWQGWGETSLPSWSLGYVYLPAFLGIICTSAVCAKLGANLAHRLPGDKLKKLFALFLLAIGIQFILRNI